MSDHAAGMLALADDRTPLTAFAEALARWLHRDQRDRQGQSYVGHLERVAGAVALEGGDEKEVAAAWLHDAVEDDRVGWITLNSLLPSAVMDLVRLLTRERQPWERLPSEDYAAYIHRLAPNESARKIKLADLRDNLDASRGPIPESLRKRYEKALARLTDQR